MALTAHTSTSRVKVYGNCLLDSVCLVGLHSPAITRKFDNRFVDFSVAWVPMLGFVAFFTSTLPENVVFLP